MKSETPHLVRKRFIFFGLFLLSILAVLDRIAYTSSLTEEKNQIVLEALEGNKVLLDELNVLLHGVQFDLAFFEAEILQILNEGTGTDRARSRIEALVHYLETHPGYFKIRLTDSRGKELFKIVENDSHTGFYHSTQLFDLSDQNFYKELNQVKEGKFFFSSMDDNIIGGQIEIPLRPTVRVAQRVNLLNGTRGLLNINIDGHRIMNLFHPDRHSTERASEKALLDSEGTYLASYPSLPVSTYTHREKRLPELIDRTRDTNELQGSFLLNDDIVVYSKVLLPNTSVNWLMFTRIPARTLESLIYHKRLTWLFWGLLCFVLMLFWFWRQEKKRYQHEVVGVLLRERNEFIQNVSHQLKTPLAIMFNSLNSREPTDLDWKNLKKEIAHLSKVVDDLLLLAFVEANPAIPLQSESILEIIVDAIDKVGAKARMKEVGVRLNIDERLNESGETIERPVMRDLLVSALFNVLDNAVDFSPPGENVEVLLTLVGSRPIIRIRDKGPGIPEDFLPRLFDRFARGRSPSRKGSGLGLPISRKIIELHEGQIRVTEHRQGTEFEITL